MPFTLVEKNRRAYLRRLAKLGKEPVYKRDIVLDEFQKLKNALICPSDEPKQSEETKQSEESNQTEEPKPAEESEELKKIKEEELEYRRLNDKLQTDLRIIKSIYNKLKAAFGITRFDFDNYERQLLNVYDSRSLFGSSRLDVNNNDDIKYLIELYKQLILCFEKIKRKFRL